MKAYRVRYLFTWFQELKDRYQESMWCSSSEDVEQVKEEFLATICMNGDLVPDDVKILEVRVMGDVFRKLNGKMGVKYEIG